MDYLARRSKMQAFIHPALFTLLFVISATAATNTTLTLSTGNTATTPVSTAAPAGASSTVPAPPNQKAPAGASSTTPAPTNQTNQTAAAGASSTTPAPTNQTNQTAPAGASTTTPAPTNQTNQTAAAGASTTTPAPTNQTNQTAPAGASTATPAPTNQTNQTAPAGASSTTPTPAPAGTCQDNSCTGGSSCVDLNNTHFCLCIDGYYYNSSSCKKGKVFPGIIQVKIPDTSGVENEKSMNYQNVYMEVSKFFKDVFANSRYGQTVIKQVSLSASAGSQMRAGDKVVSVTVVNLFAEDTKENEMTIYNAIRNATSSSSSITNYINQDRCEFYGCAKENDCSNVLQCKCQAGYERPNPYTATCLPLSRKCSYACNSKPNTQCLMKDNGSLDCVCVAGYKKDEHENCQACAFGYSGVNCEDNFLLILTILGPIAGVLILSMVIALVFVRSKKTKDTEEQNLIENDFQNLRLQQTTGFSSPAGGSIFPKITTSFPRDSGMYNPYANSRGIPRPDY